VIEAIIEDVKIKKDLFKQLDAICKPETILATNTSSLSVTELSAAVARKDKFIGMHFLIPCPS
jgi:3-hydroxybutyryl-CoA dehydrogenase